MTPFTTRGLELGGAGDFWRFYGLWTPNQTSTQLLGERESPSIPFQLAGKLIPSYVSRLAIHGHASREINPPASYPGMLS